MQVSVGHEDKDCRTLEIMKERTSYTYRVQAELMTGQPMQQFTMQPQYNNVQKFIVPPQYNNAQQFATPPQYNNAHFQYNQAPQYNTPCRENQGNRGGFKGGGHEGRGFGGGRGPVTCHNCQKLGHYARDCP
jgi:hypothetical protein